MKERTVKELEKRVDQLEDIISNKGVGSDYVQKAQRVQRDVNIGLMLGTVAATGIAAWLLLRAGEEQ